MQRDLGGVCKVLKSVQHTTIPKMIIYVQTKDMVWKVYQYLQREALKRCYVGMYHASLTSTTKSAIYQSFVGTTYTLRCLVATVAFGMVCNNYK